MTRVQPVLSETEMAIVDQVASLTKTKRTDVIKNALAVYHWFEGGGHLLSPKELELLGRKLSKTKDPTEAARLRERLTRGFYGI